MTDKNNENGESGYYEPKAPAEKEFWKTHIVKKYLYPVKDGEENAFTANSVKKAEQHKGDTQPGGKVPPLPKPGVSEAVESVAKRVKKYKAACNEAEELGEAKPDFHYQEWPGQKPKKAFNLSKYEENSKKRQAAAERKEKKDINEDANAASSDNPSMGSGAIDSGMPSPSAAGNGDQNQTNPTQDVLEKIAMQAAEIHDQLDSGGNIKDWVPATLQEVKDSLDKVYEYIVNGTDVDSDEEKTQTSEEYVAEEGPVKRGRGRPKKNPTPEEGGEGEHEHIIMQLRKVKSLKHAAPKVRFKDGSAHHVSFEHATRAMSMHDSMKSSIDKEKFAHRIHKSHEELKNAIAGHAEKPEPTLYDKIVARRKAGK